MATYIVQPKQNIFDIALLLYGTIEGIFDLLITNTSLSMDDDLVTGQELEYHEDFVLNSAVISELASSSIVPSNSERHVYYKKPTEDLLMAIDLNASACFMSFVAGGEGTMIIDWGDNTEMEHIQLSHTNRAIEHYFDNIVDKRQIKIYGDADIMKLTYFDTTNVEGTILVTHPITIDEYVSHANGYSLTGLFLFEGTYRVDLKQCTISSLLPIGKMDLQELDLLQVRYVDVSVLDEYLQYVVANYGTRRGCTVYLDTMPSEAGMAAINTILGEKEWNYPTPWKFIINGKTYTYSA